MRNRPANPTAPILVLMLAATPLIGGCGASGSVQATSESVLKRHGIVAVVEVDIKSHRGKSLGSLARNAIDTHLTSGNKEEEIVEKFREHLISQINRNLLRKGFAPVQRIKIKKALKEIAFQKTGLTRDSTAIGRMLKADAVFTAKLVINDDRGIDVPGFVYCLAWPLLLFRGSVELLFSGELTSVETGSVLASGTSSYEDTKLQFRDLDSVVGAFFDEMPGIR